MTASKPQPKILTNGPKPPSAGGGPGPSNRCPKLHLMAAPFLPADKAAAPKTFKAHLAPLRGASTSTSLVASREPTPSPYPNPLARADARASPSATHPQCRPHLSAPPTHARYRLHRSRKHRPRARNADPRAPAVPTLRRKPRGLPSSTSLAITRARLPHPLSRRSARSPTHQERTSVPPPEVSHACSRTHGSEARSASRSVDTSRRSRLVLP